MTNQEKIDQLESILNRIDSAYIELFELGYVALGNTLQGVAGDIEGKIMDLEELVDSSLK